MISLLFLLLPLAQFYYLWELCCSWNCPFWNVMGSFCHLRFLSFYNSLCILSSYLQRFCRAEPNIGFGRCQYLISSWMNDVTLKQFHLLPLQVTCFSLLQPFLSSLCVCRKKCLLRLLALYVWMFFSFHFLNIDSPNQFTSAFSQHVNKSKTLNCFSFKLTSFLSACASLSGTSLPLFSFASGSPCIVLE